MLLDTTDHFNKTTENGCSIELLTFLIRSNMKGLLCINVLILRALIRMNLINSFVREDI